MQSLQKLDLAVLKYCPCRKQRSREPFFFGDRTAKIFIVLHEKRRANKQTNKQTSVPALLRMHLLIHPQQKQLGFNSIENISMPAEVK